MTPKTFKEKCDHRYPYKGKIYPLWETKDIKAVDREDGVRVYGSRTVEGFMKIEMIIASLEANLPNGKVVIKRLPDECAYLVFVDMT